MGGKKPEQGLEQALRWRQDEENKKAVQDGGMPHTFWTVMKGQRSASDTTKGSARAKAEEGKRRAMSTQQ